MFFLDVLENTCVERLIVVWPGREEGVEWVLSGATAGKNLCAALCWGCLVMGGLKWGWKRVVGGGQEKTKNQ